MKPILVVDDEAAIADLIAMTLGAAGYTCDIATGGMAAADLLEQRDYALAVLDIMLPEVDGYELLDYAASLGVPVIFVSAKGALPDRVKGLRLGADDYLAKPFEPEELLARVDAVLRRVIPAGGGVLELWGVRLDEQNRRVAQNGLCVPLTPREFDLLRVLMLRPGTVLRREELYEEVWGDGADFDSRTLDLHINRLRKKLGWQGRIRALYGVGYLLEADGP